MGPAWLAIKKLIRTLLPCNSTRIFEQTRGDSSEDKAADMRQVCHAAGLHMCHGTCVDKLTEKPKTDQERRRDEPNPGEQNIKRSVRI